MPWINYGPSCLSDTLLERIEARYGVDYLGDWAIRNNKGQWTDAPAAVFYQPTPDTGKGHSHYLGVFLNNTILTLCNAASVFEVCWSGVQGRDGEIVISRYRHNFAQTMDGSAFVDGGQDYTRSSCQPLAIRLDGARMAQARQTARLAGKRPSDLYRGQWV